jgi:hypothetical protein
VLKHGRPVPHVEFEDLRNRHPPTEASRNDGASAGPRHKIKMVGQNKLGSLEVFPQQRFDPQQYFEAEDAPDASTVQ